MLFKISASFISVLAFLAPAAADFVTTIAPGDARVVALSPSAEGHALVWFDLAQGHLFRRLDPTGAPLADPVPFVGPTAGTQQQEIVPSRDGGWLVVAASFSTPSIWSIRLDAEGATTAGATTLSEANGFFISTLALAANNNRWLLAWGEDIVLGDVVYAQALDADGRPAAPRSTVMPVPLQLSFPGKIEAAPSPGGFLTVWSESGQIVRARETGRSGQPVGEIEDVAVREAGARRPFGGEPLTIGSEEAIAYFIGPESFQPGEIRLRVRLRRGAYADPSVLIGSADRPVGLRAAASSGERIGLLLLAIADSGRIEQRFAEFDEDLRRIGPLRDLVAETGVTGLFDLQWDPYRQRWLLLGNSGPAGPAIYLLGLDPAGE